MKPSEVEELEPGATVWVWVVRFGTGRWWPGAVEQIETTNGMPNVKVRFETFLPGRTQPITVGFVMVPMRRLERRNINKRGVDRPRFTPSSLLRSPETPIAEASLTVHGGSRHSGGS